MMHDMPNWIVLVIELGAGAFALVIGYAITTTLKSVTDTVAKIEKNVEAMQHQISEMDKDLTLHEYKLRSILDVNDTIKTANSMIVKLQALQAFYDKD
jgi:energy-converting hydrogenase Eha subunit H